MAHDDDDPRDSGTYNESPANLTADNFQERIEALFAMLDESDPQPQTERPPYLRVVPPAPDDVGAVPWAAADPMPVLADLEPVELPESDDDLGHEVSWWNNWQPNWSWKDQTFHESYYPSKGFFPGLVKTVRAASDIPLAHIWSTGLTMFGTVLGPKHLITYGFDQLAANFYTINLAGSGAGRKSTMLKIVKALLPHERFSTAIARSDRALLDILEDKQNCPDRPEWRLVLLDEASALFSQLESKYQTGLPTSLIRAWDRDKIDVLTHTQGGQTIENPCVSLLGASTEASFLPKLTNNKLDEIVSGGLFGRILFVPGVRDVSYLMPKNLPWGNVEKLQAYLHALHAQSPGMGNVFRYSLSDEAALYLKRWVARFDEHDTPPTQLNSFWSRRVAHVLKIALVYHVSVGGAPDTPIAEETIRPAVAVVNDYLIPAQHYVVTCASRNRYQRAAEDILRHLQEHKYIRYSDICLKLNVARMDRPSALADIHNKIYWEKWCAATFDKGVWKKKPGRPFLVVKMQRAALPDTIVPSARRLEGQWNVEPPPEVQAALLKMGIVEDPFTAETPVEQEIPDHD